jgi:hypothetical protein
MFALVASLLFPLLQSSPAIRVSTSDPATYGVLRFRVDDGSATTGAAAVDVVIDGRIDQAVILTPGAQRSSYEALIGPLPPGSHDIRLQPSPLWVWDTSIKLSDIAVEVVPAHDRRAAIFANAPAFGLRPDTIGNATDLPLMLYVEDVLEGGARWLKYSAIFSNEDGGTPGAALMARWGRTTDIELAYEVELRDARPAQARYQGPDHRVLSKTRLEERPPLLLVSTLNNMFLDRGRALATVRMVPRVVDLAGRTRESVMDDHPWIYRVMARELATERPAGVGDPRDYLYVDLKLDSRSAGIALGARSSNGITRWSDRGRPELAVSRQGELRIAVPNPADEPATTMMVRCDPRPDASQGSESRCTVDVRKAFRLDRDHQPGTSIVDPVRLTIDGGVGREIPVAAARIR